LKILRLCGISLFLLGSASAQESINYASISGRVTDPTGAVVQGAQIEAKQLDTNLTSTARTDRDGRFRFSYLKVGRYQISLHQQGFADVTRTVTLTVGAAFELPVSLAIGANQANVTVNGDATILESARSQIAGTVSQTDVSSLPLNGRNFLDLALLVPGVSPTNTASNQLFAETSAVPGQGLSVGSQRNFSNSFIVDGLSANDDAAGLSGIFFGLDVVQEFQVVTSGGQAELGRECLYEMHQMTRPQYKGWRSDGKGHSNGAPELVKATRAIPFVKSMVSAIRRKDQASAVISGKSLASRMSSSMSSRIRRLSILVTP